MKADLILTSDWHLRESVPSCRVDNFEETQWNKVKFISNLQYQNECPVYHAGDLFDHWKPSPYLLSKTLDYLPDQFHTIYGNHDLPQHNLELVDKCGIYTLKQAKRLSILRKSVHWGQEWDESKGFIFKGRKILVMHVMTYQGVIPYPGCTDSPARNLLRKYKDYDLILTGHNHQSFVEEFKGRLLLNPGCITRQESDQAAFEPKVWLYYAEENKVVPVIIPHQNGVVIKPTNVQVKEERQERIDAFLSKLDTTSANSVSFEDNLYKFIETNKKVISQEVKQILISSLNT